MRVIEMKRVLDTVISIILLILIFPILIVVAILVRLKLGSPILFYQARPGLHEKTFEIIKFRTMLNAFDSDGKALPDEKRLTAFGKMLRSSSLDELPELWNVIRGEMSLVGPRPLLIEYLPIYSATQRRRHDVLPGITGWAQINGRNNISWEKKFELDVWYVENQSMWLDVKILFLTLFSVLDKSGVSKDGHATTDYFNGRN